MAPATSITTCEPGGWSLSHCRSGKTCSPSAFMAPHHPVMFRPSRRITRPIGKQTWWPRGHVRVATFNRKETTMSPQAGLVLTEEIALRLRSAIPQHVSKVGAKDDEELLQDGLTMAAEMLHNLEMRGKLVTPGNVAHYTILHPKSGRRSYSGGRTDVMGRYPPVPSQWLACRRPPRALPGCAPPGPAPVPPAAPASAPRQSASSRICGPELDEAVRLGDMLTCSREDPSQAAGRNIDWEEFLSSHDCRYLCIIHDLASGRTMVDTAKACRMTYNDVRIIRECLVEDLEEYMGPSAIADAGRVPAWKGNLMQDHERMACRADRRRR